jgi:hypothetical protein
MLYLPTTKGNKMQFTLDPQVGNGTSLRGYVTTTLAQLIETFGEPERYAEGDKVTVHWSILFDNGVEATIYDWKRYEMGTPALTEVFQYNIGGHDYEAVSLVKEALRKG